MRCSAVVVDAVPWWVGRGLGKKRETEASDEEGRGVAEGFV